MKEAFDQLFIFSLPLSIYTILIGTEMIISYVHNKHYYSTKGTLANIYLSTLNFGLDVLLRSFGLFVLNFFYQFHFFELGNTFLYWLCLLVLQDFLYYVLHYVDHYCRLFWAIHVTHHSSEEFNLTVGFRSSVFQPLYRFIYFIPLALLGFRGVDIAVIYSACQIYGILIHTQTIGKLGFLEWFMATPSHHRVHHGSNPQYLDRNMGMVFIIWDKLFGTFEAEQETVKFGLTENIKTYHPVKMVFHEWKNIFRDLRRPAPLKAKLMYLFGPPGWSHDGSKKTSGQLREIWQNNKGSN
jgi:sterol desaturase/sphingolipid hydroxylase (fatty acid hydroxylase superfamily)